MEVENQEFILIHWTLPMISLNLLFSHLTNGNSQFNTCLRVLSQTFYVTFSLDMIAFVAQIKVSNKIENVEQIRIYSVSA